MSKTNTASNASSNSTAAQLILKWKLEFGKSRQAGAVAGSLENPPGYVFTPSTHVSASESCTRDGSTVDQQQHLINKRSWDMALGPVKQLPMNLFIMYMAGNSISIFPIMMVGMMFVRPIKALVTIGGTFKALEESAGYSLLGQKFVYALGNLLGVALALYKCSAMGLLPTHQSDWLAFAETPERMEYSGGGAVLI